jgi:hypothetical protein
VNSRIPVMRPRLVHFGCVDDTEQVLQPELPAVLSGTAVSGLPTGAKRLRAGRVVRSACGRWRLDSPALGAIAVLCLGLAWLLPRSAPEEQH